MRPRVTKTCVLESLKVPPVSVAAHVAHVEVALHAPPPTLPAPDPPPAAPVAHEPSRALAAPAHAVPTRAPRPKRGVRAHGARPLRCRRRRRLALLRPLLRPSAPVGRPARALARARGRRRGARPRERRLLQPARLRPHVGRAPRQRHPLDAPRLARRRVDARPLHLHLELPPHPALRPPHADHPRHAPPPSRVRLPALVDLPPSQPPEPPSPAAVVPSPSRRHRPAIEAARPRPRLLGERRSVWAAHLQPALPGHDDRRPPPSRQRRRAATALPSRLPIPASGASARGGP